MIMIMIWIYTSARGLLFQGGIKK
jgi:hypothetical protein